MAERDLIQELAGRKQDFGEQLVLGNDYHDRERTIDFTRRWMDRLTYEFDTNIYPRVKENFQLMQLKDELLEWMAIQGKRNALRSKIVLPKMQPELFTRIANEAAAIRAGSPIWRVLPPEDGSDEAFASCTEIQNGVNDLMERDNWFYSWYAIKFWSCLSPYVPVEIQHEEVRGMVPNGQTHRYSEAQIRPDRHIRIDGYGRQMVEKKERLTFEPRLTRVGPTTKWCFPWDCFFDYTAESLESAPLLFRRTLLTTEQVLERMEAGEWIRPPDDDWSKTGGWTSGQQGVARNYSLELLNSIPRKGLNVSGIYQMSKLSRRHEIVKAYAEFYDPATDEISVYCWYCLNRKYLLTLPEKQEGRCLKIPYLIVRSRPIPGFLLGMPPAESLKQIQRANDLLFNLAIKGILAHLGPINLMGQGVNFQNPDVVLHPNAFIPMTGDLTANFKTLTPNFNPESLFQPLSILDAKGQLVSDVNDRAMGVAKPGTPPSAMQIGDEEKGRATKLGLFIELDAATWMIKWAEMFYWDAMERNPVEFVVRGRVYNLRKWIIEGGPVFDMPQLGEVSGRISEKAQLQAGYSLFAQNPLFVNPTGPPLTREQAPRLYELTLRTGRALGYPWIEKVLNPPITPSQQSVPDVTPEQGQQLALQRQQAEVAQQQAAQQQQAQDQQMQLELMKMSQPKPGGTNGKKPATSGGRANG